MLVNIYLIICLRYTFVDSAVKRDQSMKPYTELKVLVVDDYASMRRIVRGLLKDNGIENCIEAQDGGEAMQTLTAQPDFDLILSDWHMEPITGLELLKWVRQNPATAHLPFVMVTAERNLENIIEAKKFGVSNYLTKPFDAESLRGKIDKVMGQGS